MLLWKLFNDPEEKILVVSASLNRGSYVRMDAQNQ